MASVPPIDQEVVPEPEPNGAGSNFQTIELRLLDAEAGAKEKLNREADQRYWLRWGAVAVTFLIILGMAIMLWHVSHRLMTLKGLGASTSYVIALYVAPIVSLTTLPIALLVAAFRGFKDTDGAVGIAAMQEGSKVSGLTGS